jgi:hypothetical protein
LDIGDEKKHTFNLEPNITEIVIIPRKDFTDESLQNAEGEIKDDLNKKTLKRFKIKDLAESNPLM